MKYDQIICHIKRMIEENEIKPGDKLPSIRDISDLFECSKSTAVKAYDELRNQHLIYSISNSGYFLVGKNKAKEKNSNFEIIDFASAAPDLEVLPYKDFEHCIEQAINLYKENLFSYVNLKGLEPLIKVMSKQLQNYQVFAKPEEIYITTGSQQALDILTRMPFPNGKSNIAIEQPTYSGMISCIELNGIKAIGIDRGIDGINMNDLERVFMNGNVKFFYTIPRFNNPFGLSYTNEEKKHIARLAEKYDVYILEDDFLGDMDHNLKADPIYAFDQNSRVIYLKSFSKVLLPGLRVAAVVLPKLLTNVFRSYKKCADLNTSVLSQGALEIYLKSGMFNSHTKKVRALYSKRLACLRETIEAIDSKSIRFNIPDGGFFSSIEVLNNTKVSHLLNSPRLKNIKFAEPSFFYLKDFPRSEVFRISIARADEDSIKSAVPIIIKEIEKKYHENYNTFEF